MPNAKDLTSPLENFMIVGDVGGGKSTGLLSLPGKKFSYCFEPNAIRAIQGHDVGYESFIPTAVNIDAITLKKTSTGTVIRDNISDVKEPTAYIQFEEDFEKKLADNFFDPYDWIAIDSTSGLQAITMDRITFLNKRYGKNPEQDDYVGCTNTMINVFRALVGTGKQLFITTHIDFKQDEVTKRLQNVLFLIGRLRKQIPQLFSEIYLAYGEVVGDKRKFYAQTQPNRDNPFLRCSYHNLKPIEDVTIDWSKPVEGQGLGALFLRNHPELRGK